MTPDRFHELCHEASHLAVSQPGRIGNLILSVNHRDESLIREPEMLHAIKQTLDSHGGHYGIEVPTVGLYRFVKKAGPKMIRARHDLALFDDRDRDVLIELKKGQPGGKDSPAISKDFQKLLREEAKTGKAMFHICHAAKGRTIQALLDKYNAAFADAMTTVAAYDLAHDERNWFALYILVMNDRKKKRPLLLSYVALSLAALVAITPVFQLDRFRIEHVPRG